MQSTKYSIKDYDDYGYYHYGYYVSEGVLLCFIIITIIIISKEFDISHNIYVIDL